MTIILNYLFNTQVKKKYNNSLNFKEHLNILLFLLAINLFTSFVTINLGYLDLARILEFQSPIYLLLYTNALNVKYIEYNIFYIG